MITGIRLVTCSKWITYEPFDPDTDQPRNPGDVTGGQAVWAQSCRCYSLGGSASVEIYQTLDDSIVFLYNIGASKTGHNELLGLLDSKTCYGQSGEPPP